MTLTMPGRPGEHVFQRMRPELLGYLGEPVTLGIDLVDYMAEEDQFRAVISKVMVSGR
jgi:hypothetical protein